MPNFCSIPLLAFRTIRGKQYAKLSVLPQKRAKQPGTRRFLGLANYRISVGMDRDHINSPAATTLVLARAPSIPDAHIRLHFCRRVQVSAIGYIRDGRALSRALTTTVTMSTSVGVNVRTHPQCYFCRLARASRS